MSKFKWLLDAGHGGILNGKYTTAPAKMHKFEDGLEILEGVINRKITALLWKKLDKEKIDFALVYHEQLDTPLQERVLIADRIYSKYKNAVYLSIHSNAGGGSGFEVFTSPGQSKSDRLANVFCDFYMTMLPAFKLRADYSDADADKEADFYVLRKTDCPAVLVENLFFDNRKEAEFLLSESGQEAIAECLFQAIKECEENLEL
jgi:N-acetylmuramoyl-L-alanine amidase